MTVLRADSIARSFGGRQVLTSATITAGEGEIVALVGRNGVGKSTLLNIACGHDGADSGTVTFMRRAYLDASADALARAGLFLVPARDLLPTSLSIGDSLACARRAGGRRALDVAEVAERLGLEAVLGLRPQAASGGERRRAELACAVIRAPRCLVADEPFRGVSPLDAECLRAEFRRAAAAGVAVIVSGHELPALFAIASRVVWCTDGTTQNLGSPAHAAADWRFMSELVGPRGL